MSETGKKAPYDAFMKIQPFGEKPCDGDWRLARLSRWTGPLLTGTLLPLLRELSDEAEGLEVRTYPCPMEPIRTKNWMVFVMTFAMLPHSIPEEEVRRRLNMEFVLPLAEIAKAAIKPLPPAESWRLPWWHYKREVGFLPLEFWKATA